MEIRFIPMMFPKNKKWRIMRILDDVSDKKLDRITIFFTKEEAVFLQGYLRQIIDNPNKDHAHLSSSDYQKEITICIYDNLRADKFSTRAKKLILEDK